MRSTGLGDDIEKFTKATGIKKMVDTVSKGLNIPCGCAARKGALNKMFQLTTLQCIMYLWKTVLWVKQITMEL